VDPTERDIEELLRKARPEPRAEFLRELEGSLQRRVAPRRVPRPLAVAGGLAGGLAAVVLGLSLTGTGGPGVDSRNDVQAGERCRTVTVTRRERKPVLVETRDGGWEIRYHRELVRKPVKRCS